MSMYDKTHYNIAVSLQLIKINGKKKKLGVKPPYDPAIPLLGIYPEATRVEKDTCIPMFTVALYTIILDVH